MSFITWTSNFSEQHTFSALRLHVGETTRKLSSPSINKRNSRIKCQVLLGPQKTAMAVFWYEAVDWLLILPFLREFMHHPRQYSFSSIAGCSVMMSGIRTPYHDINCEFCDVILVRSDEKWYKQHVNNQSLSVVVATGKVIQQHWRQTTRESRPLRATNCTPANTWHNGS